MNFTSNKNFEVKVFFVYEGQGLDMLTQETLEYAQKQLLFKGKAGQIYSHLGPRTENKILVGLGKKEALTTNILRQAGHDAGAELNKHKVIKASIHKITHPDMDTFGFAQYLAEGFMQNDYQFDRYKEKPQPKTLKLLSFEGYKDTEGLEESLTEIVNVMDGVSMAKDMVNLPPNELTPETMAMLAQQELGKIGVSVEIFGEEWIKEQGMDAYMAVADGSKNRPRFIQLSYLPLGEEVPAVALVGKGLTYDTGGYALKPAASMRTMKCDMGGSASVFGTIYALAKNQIQANVVGIVAAAENMISGNAMRNDDIVSSMKGLSIEIGNTDAEGRLTLADALYYAATQVNSEWIIDIATLTGAAVVALGDHTTAAITNNDDLLAKIQASAEASGEYVWQLPSYPEMRKQIKGEFTDLVNVTGRMGGAITAGLFLEEFVEKKPWVHLDIAGPAYTKTGWGYLHKGGTGIPVKTLYNFLKNRG